MPYLAVAPSEKGGRGVFTTKSIPTGTVVEISPVLVFSAKERKDIEKTKLFDYIFEWGARRRMAGLALGYISLYNHDYAANCGYEMDFKHNFMTIRTVRSIKKGEELCINYNASPDDKTEVWFHSKIKSLTP